MPDAFYTDNLYPFMDMSACSEALIALHLDIFHGRSNSLSAITDQENV